MIIVHVFADGDMPKIIDNIIIIFAYHIFFQNFNDLLTFVRYPKNNWGRAKEERSSNQESKTCSKGE